MTNEPDAPDEEEAAETPAEEAAELDEQAALEAARAADPTPEEDIPPIEQTSFESGSAYQAWKDAGAKPGTEKDFE